MRIKKICDYADQQGSPPAFYRLAPVRYVLRINADGSNPHIIDTATEQHRRGVPRLIPTRVRGSGDYPLLMCDHAEYMVGIPREGTPADVAKRKYWAHAEMVNECVEATGEHAVISALAFLTSNEPGHPSFSLPADFDPSAAIVFEVADGWESVIPIDWPSVRSYWASLASAVDEDAVMECLICGEERPVVRIWPTPIKGVPGGAMSGVKFVSANDEAYESYGLENNRIAPMCEPCALKLGDGLNLLLSNDATHISTRSLAYVFWMEGKEPFSFASILSQAKPEDVRHFFGAVHRGEISTLDTAPFYSAALSGNNTRLVIRDWNETTLGAVVQSVERYFESMRLVDGSGEDRYQSLWSLANATVATASRQSHEVPLARVEQALLANAFYGVPLPSWILQNVLRRVEVEKTPKASQIALLKLLLSCESRGLKQERKIMAELNQHTTDKAYLCGRLLAVLEEVHEAAITGVGKSVTERYYSRASTTPSWAFGQLMDQAQHHLAKIERDRPGMHVRLSKQIQEIMDAFTDPSFPESIDAQGQGAFAIGYWQQKSFSIRAAIAGKAARNMKEEEE